VWFNGSAQSPFLFDRSWGGMVMCGCNYNGDSHGCNNAYPDCPALVDMGQNFGAGFYNDHHYHFGYIIYAAAVVCKFNHVWCKKYHEHITLLIRDIANPSKDDPFFPTFRHKDWYLGFSWASGIVTIGGVPYPNGRNQESSSEAISAYEAVALYGEVTAQVFEISDSDSEQYESSQRMRDMGRLLLATEIRSAKTYWHVQDRQFPQPITSSTQPSTVTPLVSRIYPDEYKEALKINKDIDKAEKLLKRDAKETRLTLEELKNNIELPVSERKWVEQNTLNKASEEAAADYTPEELQQIQAEWISAVEKGVPEVSEFKFKLGDEDVSYKITEDEQKQLVDKMKSFNAESYLLERGWLNENGSPNIKKITEDVYILENNEKIFRSGWTQAKEKAKMDLISKDIKNINLDRSPETFDAKGSNPYSFGDYVLGL
jgi:hypothetical protein